MGLNIGSMRNKIDVQELTIIKDEYGSAVESYYTKFTLRAQVKYISGNKAVDNDEIFTSQIVQFQTHFREIENTMRIIFKGRKYKINFIDEIGFKEGMIINCELINE